MQGDRLRRSTAVDGAGPSTALLVAEPTACRLVPGHKGALWLRLTAHGRSAHGSRPDLGDNALVAFAGTATRVHDHDGWPAGDTHGPATVNVGAFRSGVQPNLVPDHAELDLDIRTVPGFDAERTLEGTRALAAPGTRIDRLLDLPNIATDLDDPLVRALTSALRPVPSTEPGPGGARCATYFTDASVLAGTLGSPVVLLYGPGDPEQAHTTDETCSQPGRRPRLPDRAEGRSHRPVPWGRVPALTRRTSLRHVTRRRQHSVVRLVGGRGRAVRWHIFVQRMEEL